jgi:murein DD-endopeptidase MepM/ murein hydrolase activator NlpD
LPVTRLHRDFKSDTIAISRDFLTGKAAEFSAVVPGEMSDIERFLQVNGRIRKENANRLMEIGKDTVSDALWKGPFLRLPRAASKAGFADFRAYLWQGEKIDEQIHLGFDLASVARAPVPAANSGRVVFAGYLGIYGNIVVIDHGFGLQSLYSHMSTYAVKAGQTVARGDIIGATGATGMAGGDHLHFGILISGLEVTPLEWLDAHWIRDNISERVRIAGGILPNVNAE